MAKKSNVVARAFTLTHDDFTTERFEQGQTVSDELAAHWYVSAHLADAPAEEAPPAADPNPDPDGKGKKG